MSIFSHRCEYCPLSEYPETPFYSVSDKGLTNRINQYIGRIQVCFRYHVLERQRQSAFVRQDAASVLCCGCGKTCCAPSKNSLRMMTAVEYGMLSNMWSIPQAKREVRYGLKKLQLFSFPIMWLGLTVRKSGTFCGIRSVA